MAVRPLKPESIHTLKIALWILSITAMILAWVVGIEDGLKACAPLLLFGMAFSPLPYNWIDRILKHSGYVYMVVLGLAFAVIMHSCATDMASSTYTSAPVRPTKMSDKERGELKTHCEIAASTFSDYYGDCMDKGKAEWEKENL